MKAKLMNILGGCFVIAASVAMFPNFIHERTCMLPSCVNNLRQLDGAKGQWALEFHKTANDIPNWDDLRPFLKGQMLSCPQHGIYALGRVGELTSCSIAEHTARYRQPL